MSPKRHNGNRERGRREMAKLIGLSIEGLRKIKAMRLEFDGKHLVQIRGRNEAGKSTVLDAIDILFRGGRAIPEDVVNHEMDRSVIVGQVDDYTIRRVIKRDGQATLTVQKEGEKTPRPQEFLDTLAGRFLDPAWFSALEGAKKKTVLMEHLGIDFSQTDGEIEKAEEDRRLVGREGKAIGELEEVEEVERKSFDELRRRRQEVLEFNEEQEQRGAVIARNADEIRERMVEVLRSRSGGIEELREDLATVSGIYDEEFPKLRELPRPEEPLSLEDVDLEIGELEEHNRKAQLYEDYLGKKELKERKRAEYQDLTERISGLKQQKLDVLAEAPLPVPGLEITDTGLSHDGITDENWSQSESLKISMLLAAAFSGELQCMYIKRGESLDSESLEKVKQFAEKKDFQVFIEVVDSEYGEEGDGVIYIEDGSVVN